MRPRDVGLRLQSFATKNRAIPRLLIGALSIQGDSYVTLVGWRRHKVRL